MEYDPLKLENQLCFPLYACSREIVKKYKPFLDALGLTYTQYVAMLVLWEETAATVKELGEKLHLDSGTLTPMLKKMEAQELISRARDGRDERSVIIELTEKGALLREKAVEVPGQMARCVPLDVEEAVALKRLLDKLLEQISQS